jgi:uncharacterized membrane protein
MEIRAPAADVWDAIVAIDRYPASMDNVRSVEILDDEREGRRRSVWSVLLKGSILEWEEVETIDSQRLTMTFEQVAGDMERLDGEWAVSPEGEARTSVRLRISFDIGIPLLADMLNPVAQRALRDNCAEMLRGVERAALERPAPAPR